MEPIVCGIVKNDTIVNVIFIESLKLALEIFDEEVVYCTNEGPHMGWTRSEGIWSAPIE